jgi:two-component system, OmpR family, phosphate regulon response regulator PhoB
VVVDDDAALRMLCRVNLELEGYHVDEAESVGSANDLLAQRRPDVVLLDVHLGADNGLELLRTIRSQWPDVAVALFTGSADAETAKQSGADAILPKPFSLDELSATVSRLAESRASGTLQRP